MNQQIISIFFLSFGVYLSRTSDPIIINDPSQKQTLQNKYIFPFNPYNLTVQIENSLLFCIFAQLSKRLLLIFLRVREN